ncbi:hypothetical protein JCM10908_005698 [Rhodotorula pacifica]|uniref:ribonuclease H family protein n=1 Tax=Rhodotorula pacifica TaxID=1495444 RepID=UPI00317F3D4F
MYGIAGAGVALRVEREGEVLWASRSRGMGQYVGIYDAELEGLRVALSCAAQLLPTDYPAALHILADNQAAVTDPINARPSPGQSTRLASRHLLEELAKTHLDARIVVTWVPGHLGVEGNEQADELAKEAVQVVGARIKALVERRKRAEGARRAKRVLAYRYKLNKGCTSDGSSEEEDDDGDRAGLGRFPATRPAISTSPPIEDGGRIRHGRLLPRSVSACWSSFKAAQQATWASLWSSSSTGGGLRAVTSSPPGPSFARYHATLLRRQSTLLTRLCTGACDLGAYKAHFEPDRLMCACGGEPETREHYFLHCPLYARQRADLLTSLRLETFPSITYLLSDSRATKATLRFVADSGRFDSLFCPPSEDSPPPKDGAKTTIRAQRTTEKKKETIRRRIR